MKYYGLVISCGRRPKLGQESVDINKYMRSNNQTICHLLLLIVSIELLDKSQNTSKAYSIPLPRGTIQCTVTKKITSPQRMRESLLLGYLKEYVTSRMNQFFFSWPVLLSFLEDSKGTEKSELN